MVKTKKDSNSPDEKKGWKKIFPRLGFSKKCKDNQVSPAKNPVAEATGNKSEPAAFPGSTRRDEGRLGSLPIKSLKQPPPPAKSILAHELQSNTNLLQNGVEAQNPENVRPNPVAENGIEVMAKLVCENGEVKCLRMFKDNVFVHFNQITSHKLAKIPPSLIHLCQNLYTLEGAEENLAQKEQGVLTNEVTVETLTAVRELAFAYLNMMPGGSG